MNKKSVVALLLALVMCFSLCACGGGSEPTPEEQVIGAWEAHTTEKKVDDITYAAEDIVLIFEEDNTGTLTIDEGTPYVIEWSCNTEENTLDITLLGKLFTNDLPITHEDGRETMILNFGGLDTEFTKNAE